MTGQHRLAAWRGRRKKRTVTSLALIALGAVVVSALPSVAAPGDETLTLTLSQQTGTGPFDADDAPGHDSGAGNDVVRTNDTVTYTVGIRYEGGDATAPTMTFTLPQGQELVSLPPFCGGASSVTPASIGAPTLPVTSTSYQSLPTQTVTCVVDNQSEGTALDYKFVAKVRPEMPQGASMGPFSVSATTNQVSTPAVSPSVTQVVSAAADFDVSKRGTSTNENTGPYYQEPAAVACSFDATRSCRRVHYPLTVNSTPGGKGITPLASPITMTDDISPAVFYGPTVWAAAVTAAGSEAAAVAQYAPRLNNCGNITHLWGGLPYTGGGSESGNHNAVTNSGVIDCAQPGGTGTPIDVTITGADTTGYYVPTQTGNTNPLPADTGYVIAFTVLIDVPMDAVLDLGIVGADGNSWTLATENTYTDIVANDITGNPNTGEDLSNNDRDAVIAVQTGEGFNKYFSGQWGRAGNTSAGAFSPGTGLWQGPPGSAGLRDGNTVVLPGQPIQSNLYFNSTGIPNSGTTYARSYFGCDVWDESKLALTAANVAGSGTPSSRPSGGAPAWISYFAKDGSDTLPISELDNLRIEFSSGPAGSGSASDCTTGSWFTDPADVPGATVDGAGIYSGVNRVRVSFSSEYNSVSNGFTVNLAIAQTVKSTAGVQGDVIGNWGAYKRVDGVTDLAGVLADPSASYQQSNYVPATHADAWGDRLTIGTATARIRKWVRNGPSGPFTDTAVPQYAAGNNVDYRLNPTLTADVPAGVTAPVVIEDCLPRYQQFVSSKHETTGDAITPDVVQLGAPAGSELTCPTNRQYVRWNLGQQAIGTVIDPIVYTVEILGTALNGVYTNTTLVSSEGDPTAAALRRDSVDIQVVVPTGIKIAKSTPQTVVEVNPDGVAAPRRLQWSVDFANVDAPQNVSNVDVIDVLPTDGLNGSDFTGSLRFDSAAVTAGTGIALRYTKAPSTAIVIDPAHASNGAAGATVWCDAPAGGAVVSGSGTAADCPASPAQVTGLRFVRPGDFEPGDELTVGITMTPSGNRGGDVYVNRTSGRADGVSQSVGPASRAIEIISSSIGDRVWIDQDRDGVQDAGEPGLSGFTVRLSGTDLDGNTVTASTTTGADGSYLFDGLASGTYTVTFDPASLKAWQTFTQQGVGGDRAEDSDGEVTTGVTAPIVLAPDSANLDIDQGVVLEPSQPGYVTTISDQATEVGDRVTDQVVVSGLVPGAPVQMKWELYGPYPTKAAITCAPGSVFAEGTMTVAGNGTVTTPPVTLTKAGWYTYVQSNEASAAYDAQRTACAIPAETTHTTVKQAPPGKSEVKVSTVSSRQALVLPSRGGVKVTDKVIVRGLPKGVKARVTGALYGPFETEKAIRCTKAHVVKKVAFTATGRARTTTNYRSKAVRVTEPGWYSWSMTVAGTTFTKAATEGCGVARETLIATRAAPPVPSVPTGFTGEARESALSAVESDVAGVFADGDLDFLEQIAQVLDVADGVEDGNIPAGDAGDLPVVSVKEAQEVAERQASGIDVPQVALAPRHTRRLYSPPNGRGVVRRAGTSLSIPSLGIKTSVDDSRVTGGVLAVPKDVRRVGWYSRTAHVDDVIGSTVIAGHVSDDRDNPGALYRLKSLKKGAVVTVTENGRTRRFRVTRMRTYQRTGQLPADAFATTGAHRLTLITCTGKVTYPNGKFHYTKNLVVTADEI